MLRCTQDNNKEDKVLVKSDINIKLKDCKSGDEGTHKMTVRHYKVVSAWTSKTLVREVNAYSRIGFTLSHWGGQSILKVTATLYKDREITVYNDTLLKVS